MARTPVFERLPPIWKRLDLPDGLLERFLGVWDAEFDRIHDKIGDLLDLRSPDRIPDRYLPLLGVLLGHEWDSTQSYAWNRTRIRDAIRRHSYRGTVARIRDIALENGAASITIQDNASKLAIWGKQGGLGTDGAMIMGPDYWHEGSFVLRLPNTVNLSRLRAEMQETAAAGERWWLEIAESMERYFFELTGTSYASVGAAIIAGEFIIAGTTAGYGEGHCPTVPIGAYLTADSALPCNLEIPCNSGCADVPLSDLAACYQPAAGIIIEE